MTDAAAQDWADWVHTLVDSRQTILPKRLQVPGPDAHQLQRILGSAAAAPDHGQITPWRFVLVPSAQRARLGEVFVQALCERDPLATAEQQGQAREKADRAPVLLLAVARLHGGDPEVDAAERLISLGCALQNILLTAHAHGFGAALTSGKAMKSQALRDLFDIAATEQAICFVSIGTAQSRRAARIRPQLADYVTELGPGGTGSAAVLAAKLHDEPEDGCAP